MQPCRDKTRTRHGVIGAAAAAWHGSFVQSCTIERYNTKDATQRYSPKLSLAVGTCARTNHYQVLAKQNTRTHLHKKDAFTKAHDTSTKEVCSAYCSAGGLPASHRVCRPPPYARALCLYQRHTASAVSSYAMRSLPTQRQSHCRAPGTPLVIREMDPIPSVSHPRNAGSSCWKRCCMDAWTKSVMCWLTKLHMASARLLSTYGSTSSRTCCLLGLQSCTVQETGVVSVGLTGVHQTYSQAVLLVREPALGATLYTDMTRHMLQQQQTAKAGATEADQLQAQLQPED
jgi:hypothetical protein